MGQTRQAGDIVGDYRLTKAVSDGTLTRTWKAEQVSVQRDVMLEMLKRQSAADVAFRDSFVADVRAKAAVRSPIIGAVYEAYSDSDATFYARERLFGESLETWIEQGKKLTPLEVVTLTEQIAAAQLHLEELELASVPIAAHHIVIEGPALRMINLVADGAPDERQATEDKQLVGALFDEMLKPGLSGSTRVSSLLAYMADLDRPVPLTWTQIKNLSRQVIDQLEGNILPTSSQTVPQETPVASKMPGWVWALIGSLILVGGTAAYFMSQKPGNVEPSSPEEVALSPVKIAPGLHLSVHEVTIGQYRNFLESLSHLSAEDQAAFNHPQQPAEKTDHLPTDWTALAAAAEKGGVWSGRLVSDGCPIIGVDWWDAHAFATWQGSRLPTLDEWQAAAQITPAIAGWGKATSPVRDRSKSGLIGMAGNVSEWTRDSEINPAYQLRPKKPVACGGSFLTPSTGVSARTWLKDRSDRAEDLGFRTLFEK